MKKFAVILSGCGHRDGSEIHEAVTLLLSLDQHHCEYQCFAPNRSQHDVVNHLTGEAVKVHDARSFMVTALVCAACLILFAGICVTTTKERITTTAGEKFSLKRSISIIKWRSQKPLQLCLQGCGHGGATRCGSCHR